MQQESFIAVALVHSSVSICKLQCLLNDCQPWCHLTTKCWITSSHRNYLCYCNKKHKSASSLTHGATTGSVWRSFTKVLRWNVKLTLKTSVYSLLHPHRM